MCQQRFRVRGSLWHIHDGVHQVAHILIRQADCRGRADAVVLIAQNEAAAEALKKSVAAFKGGAGFASYTFSQRLAPSIRTVFASPEGPFGALFRDLIPEGSPSSLGGGR